MRWISLINAFEIVQCFTLGLYSVVSQGTPAWMHPFQHFSLLCESARDLTKRFVFEWSASWKNCSALGAGITKNVYVCTFMCDPRKSKKCRRLQLRYDLSVCWWTGIGALTSIIWIEHYWFSKQTRTSFQCGQAQVPTLERLELLIKTRVVGDCLEAWF